MSLISTLHDAIVTKISTNLTGYTQLPNPYDIEDNNKLYLKKGFGVAVGPGNRSDRIIGCKVSWQRFFNVTLINAVTTTDHNTTSRETIAKSLLEDHYTLLSQFEINAGLGGNAIDGIVIQDSGIEFIIIDGTPYYMSEIEIGVEYFEDLTSI